MDGLAGLPLPPPARGRRLRPLACQGLEDAVPGSGIARPSCLVVAWPVVVGWSLLGNRSGGTVVHGFAHGVVRRAGEVVDVLTGQVASVASRWTARQVVSARARRPVDSAAAGCAESRSPARASSPERTSSAVPRPCRPAACSIRVHSASENRTVRGRRGSPCVRPGGHGVAGSCRSLRVNRAVPWWRLEAMPGSTGRSGSCTPLARHPSCPLASLAPAKGVRVACSSDAAPRRTAAAAAAAAPRPIV